MKEVTTVIVLPSSEADAARHLLFDGAMSNLNMFVLGLGAERTEEQYRALLAKAGFVVTQIIPTRAMMGIIEARPIDDSARCASEPSYDDGRRRPRLR